MSVSTVSRALNGYSDVNPQTRSRIEATAREIGYTANYAASVLRRQRTRTVTYIASKPWTKFVDPFHLGLFDGLEAALQVEGYDLHVVMARDFDGEMKIIQRLVEMGRCDGVIFGRTRPFDERIDYLMEREFPFVTLGRTHRNDHDWVDRDHYRIGNAATRRLIELGHERIATLSTPLCYTFSEAAVQGYRDALREAGIAHDPAMEAECSPSQTGEEVFGDMVAGGAAPTAVFCGNDIIATGVISGARRHGLEPGRDFAVIGCDDVPLATYLRPALTTFAQDLDAVGRTMGQMILSRLDGRRESEGTVIESFLIARESDCPAAGA